MPELPEIETICKSLQTTITNHQIKQIIIRKDTLRWPINPELNKILQNKTIKNIYRRAKYLLLNCYNKKDDNSGHLIIHLGMSGKLSIVPKHSKNYNIIDKHDHVDLILQNDTIIRYNDPRRFGSILWTTDNPLKHNLLVNLGPEPFDASFTARYLLKKANKILLPIKQFIMDNKIVVGIGNIYANEALFKANIHPMNATKNLNLLKFQNLITAIQQTLKTAILQGGTTLKDFFDPNGKPGYFSQNIQVYGRANQPCLTCNTIISQVKLGQRSTFFCKNCQPYEKR
ncbi:MAG: bifunctional DNA-formamidopyrimidine glycosylase/DNA-(apurinic or apyrimidinic site) lyase [Gammaproteobacteria bacterium]|jgi:formamidopyrimidine-DNA glycosylase